VMLMAGDECHRGGDIPVGQGDARIGRRADTGRHPGHNFKGNPGIGQGLALLAAATEDERVAPLEPGNDLAGQRLLDEKLVDLPLLTVVGPPNLAGIDQFGIGRGKGEERFIGKVVVDDDIGPGDAFPPLDGYESGVAGTGADQVDFALLHGYLWHIVKELTIEETEEHGGISTPNNHKKQLIHEDTYNRAAFIGDVPLKSHEVIQKLT